MTKTLSYLNFILSGGLVVLAIAIAALMWMRPHEIPLLETKAQKAFVPKGSFVLTKQDYDAIGEPFLALQYTPPTMRLPDLRQHLTYYGMNGRPDVAADRTLLHFALSGSKSPSSVAPGERLYLIYDKKQIPPKYICSSANSETSLWIEPRIQGNETLVQVGMKNEKGELVVEPENFAQFSVQEKEFARFGGGGTWEIGKWRVDGTLLARQKARWFGLDRFLEKHGGDEYADVVGSQRIDFGENEDVYSCYLKQSDYLIWENDRWQNAKNGDCYLGKPLLYVKKVDERLICFDLWDAEGKGKITLNLLKSNEPWAPQILQQSFKFVGARTRTQCVFEVNKERMLLRPQDWLVFIDGEWKKLKTAEEIDDYVNRKIAGPLFVFDGIIKKDERQVLVGTIFNASRTDMQTIELAVQQTNVTISPIPTGDKGKDQDENHKAIIPLASTLIKEENFQN